MTALVDETIEAYRPALHYTAQNTWLNDPNGLIYHKGVYHLFYQNNPMGTVWGNMSWGHATSTNLIEWQELPVAIACDDNEGIFSGSIVFDAKNSSGLGTSERPPLVAVYTSAYTPESERPGVQAQSLAYSTDDGLTWKRYQANPVLDRGSADFRDPKVFWYTAGSDAYWVMVAVEALERKVVLYKSSNLIDWSHLSDFGPANATAGIWECPDLFALIHEADPSTSKWVMSVNMNPGGINGGSAGQYFIGEFDGTTFVSETTVTEGEEDPQRLAEYQWLDWGRDYYAAVSFSDAPDGRRIMIGWMNNWDYANLIPSTPWRGPMAYPREVTLTTVNGHHRLRQLPVTTGGQPEETTPLAPSPLAVDEEPQTFQLGSALAKVITLEVKTVGEVVLTLHNSNDDRTTVLVNPAGGTLVLDRSKSGQTAFAENFASVETALLSAPSETVSLTIIIDACSVEVFAEDGLTTITDLVFPEKPYTHVTIHAAVGSAEILKLELAN